jgi:hypothetical protein
MFKTVTINKKHFIVLLTATLLLTGSVCFGATYYIDATKGNDNNDGLSQADAWKTVEKINKSLFKPGDQILFKRNENWHEGLVPPSSGSLGNPIIFGSYGTGNMPVIDADHIRNWCIYLDQKDHIAVRNLELKNSINTCILIKESNYVVLDGLHIHHAYNSGIEQWNPNNNSDHITIMNCEVSYCGGSGILIAGSGLCNQVLIEYNEVHHNCLFSENFYHRDTAGIKIWGAKKAQDAVIQHNHSYSNGNTTGDAIRGVGIWIDEWANNSAIVRYNKTHDNAYTGIMVEHCDGQEVYYNIVYNEGWKKAGTLGDGISIYRNANYNKIFNNTIYNCLDAGISVIGDNGDDTHNNLVKNNISIGSEQSLEARNGGEHFSNYYENNCFGPETTNYIEWGAGVYKSSDIAWELSYGRKTFSINSDPKFVDAANYNFRLNSNSPCIDSGVFVGLYQDFTGKQISENTIPDIGAFEYPFLYPPKLLRIIQN